MLRFDVARRSGIERLPALVAKVNLAPGMGIVLSDHVVAANAVELAGSVARDDARPDSDGPAHGRQRRGEEFTMPLLVIEEKLHDWVLVSPGLGIGQGVLEVPAKC